MKVLKTLTLCAALLFGAVAYAQNVKITGTVVDADSGEPIIGAAVIVPGTTQGTSTDIDGKFTLDAPAGTDLEFSCIGYSTITVKAASSMNVRMQVDNRFLDEVVVTGYMTEKKSDLTGSVSVVKMKEVADIPTGNVMTALQGRVAGMNVSTDGTPGGVGTSSLIRGTTTINNASPLYVIDGVMTRSNIGTIISSNDIESMQVLKDAASAAIYGAQAANGVIIITTKRAKEGQIRVDFQASLTLQTVRQGIPLMNAQQWGDVYWAAYKNDFGVTPKSTIYGDGPKAQLQLGKPYWTDPNNPDLKMLVSDTDWFKESYRNALMQNYSLSISKGTKDHVSSLSFNVLDQDGTLRNSDYLSLGTRYNTEYRFFDNRLKIGESLNLTYWTQHEKPNGYESIERQILAQHPAQAIYATDGSYAGAEMDLLGSRQNPIRYIDNEANNIHKSWRIFGNAYAEVMPVKDLTIRSTFGLNYNPNYANILTPAWDEHVRSYSETSLDVTHNESLEWVWSNTAQYNFLKGIHSLTALVGTEAKKIRTDITTATGTGFGMTNRDYVYISRAEGTKTADNSANIYAMTSYFAKVNYTLAERYLFSATVRRDASSRFGKDNNSGIFPSVSFGWRINKEKFMANASNWLSDLKLRTSWGINGNDQINNTATYSIYNVNIYNSSYNLNGDDHTLSYGAIRTQTGNDNLRWEQTEQWNVGFDAAFLNNRLSVTFDAYTKNTTGMLYQLSLPAIYGEGASSWQNCAAMNNKGIEVLASWRDTVGEFSYEISGNAALQKNSITDLPEDIYWTFGCGNANANVTNVGLPYGGRVGYKTDGVFHTQKEVDDYMATYTISGRAPGVGRIKYVDVNDDKVIDAKDQYYIGSDLPKVQFGLNFSANWRNFDLSLFFNGMIRDVYNTSKLYTDFFPLGEGLGNHSTRLVEAMNAYYEYEKTGTYNCKYAAPTTINSNNENQQSDWYVENGNYIRLKNIVLGYTIPSQISQKFKLRTARVFVQGQNLLTLTKYTGPDPEATGYPYPFGRNFVFGVNIGF